MDTIAISLFRANLLNFLKKVKKGKKLRLTSNGQEMAILVPPDDHKTRANKRLEKLRQTAAIGDVISPISNDWKVFK